MLSWQTLFAGSALECLAACYAYKRYHEIDIESELPTTAKPMLQDADSEDDEHIEVEEQDEGSESDTSDDDERTHDTTTTSGKPRKSTVGAWRTTKLTEMTTAP